MRQLLRDRWRQDRAPLFLYLLTFILMSYPFVFHMRDSLPIHNTDTFEILSKSWSLRQALVQGNALDHNNLLFFPNGLDVTLQPQRWTAFPLWTALYSVFGDPLAYNLVNLSGILLKAYGTYLFGLFLFRSRIASWACGAFYAFSASILAMALRNPDTGASEWIPWLMLCLAYGLRQIRIARPGRKLIVIMVLAGLCFSLNAYMHLRIAIFALLIGGPYVAWQSIAQRLWSRRTFWIAMLVFALTAAVTSAPLLLRTLRSELYGHAIDRPVAVGAFASSDLLNFLKAQHDRPINYRQVIASLSSEQLEVSCLCRGISHVGVVAFVFAAMGAIYIFRFKRRESFWIILSVFSFLLSLGVVIYVNGKSVDFYWTPYRLLQDNFFLKALWHPFRMVNVFMFPFSILVGFGIYSRLRTAKKGLRESTMLVVSIAVLMYGTSIFPIPMVPSPRPSYLSILNTLPAGAVIDLPMGRHNSKYYMSLQRFHGRPMVEGMLPRTPPSAYDYVSANPLLANLYRSGSLGDLTENEWRDSVDVLLRDGFRYVVVHERIPREATRIRLLPESIAEIFATTTPVYENQDHSIYDLETWRWLSG